MITVLVSNPSSSSILGLPPVEFYLVLGASIAALAVAVSLVIVRTSRTKGTRGSDGIFSQAPARQLGRSRLALVA